MLFRPKYCLVCHHLFLLQQLVAALLSRQHLILSGRAGIGKRQLAHSLALSIAEGRQDHVRLIQGHPWWAARTGNVGFFVNLQTQFSVWQLAIFIEAVLNGAPLSSRNGSTEIVLASGSFVLGIHEAENQKLAEKLILRIINSLNTTEQ